MLRTVAPDREAPPGSLTSLVPSWELSLRAARKSPKTIKSYTDAASQMLGFFIDRGMPTTVASIRREHVEAFVLHLIESRSASTAATRFRGLQQMFKWLEEEGEIPSSPMAKMKPPRLDEVPVPVLSEDEVRALLAACEGKGFDERRDMAMLRLMVDTGCRREEVAGLGVADIDFAQSVAFVVGKGRRTRACPFGPKTGAALDRYIRARRQHRSAKDPALWLGVRGPMSGSGVAQIVRKRGEQAGLAALHPHQLRHTFAHSWLADGGTEGDLMRLGGWRSRQMLDRYGASAADQRARDAHARHSLGDRV
jgi:site-specific recombinase XerD